MQNVCDHSHPQGKQEMKVLAPDFHSVWPLDQSVSLGPQ